MVSQHLTLLLLFLVAVESFGVKALFVFPMTLGWTRAVESDHYRTDFWGVTQERRHCQVVAHRRHSLITVTCFHKWGSLKPHFSTSSSSTDHKARSSSQGPSSSSTGTRPSGLGCVLCLCLHKVRIVKHSGRFLPGNLRKWFVSIFTQVIGMIHFLTGVDLSSLSFGGLLLLEATLFISSHMSPSNYEPAAMY